MKPIPFLLALVVFGTSPANAWKISSGPERVGLLELYTSEGCSSCPPADAWLGKFRTDPELWTKIVPVAFHVDYWDRLGWPDKLAKAAFTARQRTYAAEWQSTTVYTPGVVWNGQEVTNWRQFQPATTSQPGALQARSIRDEVKIVFAPAADFSGGIANLAWLGSNLESDVRAGENRGRTLEHSFVALDVERAPLKQEADGSWSAILPNDPPEQPKLAAAIWISTADSPTPVQAAGGWIQ